MNTSPSFDGPHPLLAPCSRDELQAAVVVVLMALGWVNRIVFASKNSVAKVEECDPSDAAIKALLRAGDQFYGPALLDGSSNDADVCWERVKACQFADSMEQLYDFAYMGQYDVTFYPAEFGDETSTWWIALLLKAIAETELLSFYDEYSRLQVSPAAKLLLQVCEAASARNILEGASETFMQNDMAHRLTFRQMALLSGMKEDSLRVMANPKRSNPLPTQNEGGQAFVAPEAARAWLNSKGRHIELRARLSQDQLLDLQKRQLRSVSELNDALSLHVSALATLGDSFAKIRSSIRKLADSAYSEVDVKIGAGTKTRYLLDLSRDQLMDGAFMSKLGVELQLDGELLALKAKELLVLEQLAGIASQIAARSSASKS